MKNGSFFSGMSLFLVTLFRVVADPHLRVWYRGVVLRSVLFSAAIFTGLLFGGGWIWSQLSSGWWSGVGYVLWVVSLLFVSGKLAGSLMGVFMGLLLNEKKLLSAFLGQKVVALKSSRWGDVRREYQAAGLSIFSSLLGWPLFLIPFLIPLGVCLFAYLMGRESVAIAQRIVHQNQEQTFFDEAFPNAAFVTGLGFVPALMTLIPVVGWAFWPLLVAAAIQACQPTALGSETTVSATARHVERAKHEPK